ncbi:alcohol oxidase [Auricularia subglabra TFB-10046 SS5]|nr:alcohol oxidase [Auricularia subglabra TFB-10046 SS5]
MRSAATFIALASCAGLAAASPTSEPQRIRARNLVQSSEMQDSYDFVIVGGGLAGLVLGARLSEDAKHTVLVLEAGGTGEETEAVKDRITIPGYTYYAENIPGVNWGFQTVPQPAAGGKQLPWPRGKVLGGSGAINGMYLNRPGEIEIQTWHDLLGDMDGADNWTWDTLFAAMKKSETFDPPQSDAIAKQAAITYNAASHGTNGPIHYSYPGYTFDTVGQWSTAMQNLGMQISDDTYGGKNWGIYVSTSSINPSNWTRSYSKSGYLDPLAPRQNYHVVTNAYVTRLLFDSNSQQGNLTANAVEYSLDGTTTKTVKVNKEVILAGGTVGSPTVLLYSGVGPRDVLSAAGVDLVSELPGVGQHLQDHLSLNLQWTTNTLTAGAVYNGNGPEKNDPVFLSFINSATGYLNSTAIFGDGASDFVNGITSTLDVSVSQLSSITKDATVVEGYKAIYGATAKIAASPIGQLEMLLALNSANAVRITAALQHPLSHGRIWINSANPFDAPQIDPNYLAHGADRAVLRQGLRIANQLGNTEPLKSIMTGQVLPPPGAVADDTDAEWDAFLQGQIGTEFHPSSSCAMLPLSLGGVVDAHLRVYGLANVRVADASVPPIVFSAHLMASTYGLAEHASDLIRATYNGGTVPGGGSNGGNGGNGGDDGGNGAAVARPLTLAVALLVVAVARFLF